jgi:hypothetical protein
MKIKYLLLIFLPLFIFTFDKYCSKFGNGIIHHHYDLKFGLKLYKLNDVYLTSDKNWKFETYIAPSENYILKNGDTILIVNLFGYSIGKENVSVDIKSNDGSLLTFTFFNLESVHLNNPIITSTIKKSNKNFIDIKNKPFFVKKWGAYFCILMFVWFLLFIWSINNWIKNTSIKSKLKH